MKKFFQKIWHNDYLLMAVFCLSIFALAFFPNANLFASFIPFGPEDGLIMPPESDITGTTDEGAKVLAGGIMMIVDLIRAIAGAIAVLLIVFMGVQMVTAGGNEEQTSKAIKGATWAFVSLGLILLVEPMIKDVLYRGGDVLADEKNIQASIAEGTRQIMGFLEWGKALIITVAIMYLILSGWKMIQALGDQETMTTQKQVFLWIGVGLVIIALNDVVINEVVYKAILEGDDNFKVIFQQNPVKGITEFVGIIKFILKFVALLAFVAFIWGAGLFLFSFGNDEMVDKGKKVMVDALIGIVVILISYALVSTLMTGQVYSS